ncbi:MAG TPA: tRNA pseudouridine(55) synthase TruB [Acidimicrobiales bacterium]|jgi:tRNA pseudouridine55 synthase
MTTSNGLLLIDKPQGITSHDVVARVRLELGERRVGHAGTLDPMATGLLVLAVGPSTRLLRFAQSETKRYCGTVTFGVATDSLDADGEVLERRAVRALSELEVNEAASAMLGAQRQTPPMVSALKVGGRRLHALAREGLEVERAARDIAITQFRLRPTTESGVWEFDVTCSVGTYVRVLLSDLAQRLGTIGHLSSLRRLASGEHDVNDALTLLAFKQALERGVEVLKSPRLFVSGLEHVDLSVEQERRVRMGQHLELDQTFQGSEIAALAEDASLIGVLRRRGEKWKPQVVLTTDASESR